MAMTKADYIAIADGLRSLMPTGLFTHAHWISVSVQRGIILECAEAIAYKLEQRHPQFNRARFIGYIKGENGPYGGSV